MFLTLGIVFSSFFSNNISNISFNSNNYFKNLSTSSEMISEELRFSSANNYEIDFIWNIKEFFGPTRKDGFQELELENGKAVILDVDSNTVLFKKKYSERVQIASISKLMTALVFLDTNPGWKSEYEIKRNDRVDGGKIFLYLGEKVKVKDLFNTSLVASANTATLALVHSSGLSECEFVRRMNQKADEFGFLDTYFGDSVGLSVDNVSTALEVAKLANIAFKNEYIRDALKKKIYKFKTKKGKIKEVESTNELLEYQYNDIIVKIGKTGYTDVAGYCLVAISQKKNKEIISVILGAKNKEDRFDKTKKMFKWTFDNYNYNYE